MKIVVLDGFMVQHGGIVWPLDEMFDVTWYDHTPESEICTRIADAQAVFVNRTPLPAEVFTECKSLQFACTFGTGVNHIQLDAARQAGVTVCNVPDYGAAAVAQHTIALLLAIACQTHAHDRYIKDGLWTSLVDPPLVGRGAFELGGKTLGLIGLGSIAREVATAARGLGLRVVASRQHPTRESGDIECMPLDKLLCVSDIVSLHCPLTAATHGMVSSGFLAQMKHGAVLLNTARGALLDEQAVAAALDSGALFMAGLDVFAQEPVVPDHPLAFHPQVIATPHVAWTPDDTRRRLLALSAQNLLCFLEGTPRNVVN